MKRKRQTEFTFHTWGGTREGAGPKRRLPGKAQLPHVVRKSIPARIPVHVTWRVAKGVETLRTRAVLVAALQAFGAAQEKFGMRITHFTIESNHLHLIVEGVNSAAMKGLGVRLARAINRAQKRDGKVIGDRYDAEPLLCPTQIRNAIHYVLYNHKKHTGFGGADEFTSVVQQDVVRAPRTWLLNHPAPAPS